MEPIYEKQITLLAKDVDFKSRWRTSAVFTAMQEIAEDHVTQVETLGYFELRKRSIAWVLTRLELLMDRYPLIGEEVRIITWPGETKHSVYPRYFEFCNNKGETLGKAASLWVLMDIEKRAMLSSSQSDAVVITKDAKDPCMPLPKTPRAKTDLPLSETDKHPLFCDIDVNGHVNNAKYIDWLCDLYPLSWHETHILQHLCINYSSEVRPEEALVLQLHAQEMDFSLHDRQEGKPHFTISGEWMMH